MIDGRYIQDHFPGVGRYTYNLIRALGTRATGDQIAVLHNPALPNTRFDVPSLAGSPATSLTECRIRTFSLAEQWRLPLAARRWTPHVFHAPLYLKPYLLRYPTVVSIHDLIPLRYPAEVPGRGKRYLFWLLAWLACRTSHAIITPSEASWRDVVELFRVPSSKLRIVYDAADERFQPKTSAEISRVRHRYGLPDRYLLYFGSNKPRKNLSRLVDAWAQVRRTTLRGARKDDAALVLAGREDARYPQARERARELGVTDSVLFPGDIAERDAPALYSGAEVFVFPSLYEGFGLPVVEAMACGTPVVCSNTSSVPEVAGDAAVLVNPREVSALAEAISRILEDRYLGDELRERGLARAATFSWHATADATYQVYEDVARADGITRD
jgi:glycosyltransferase involved in cell wall biosynthesis